MHTPCHTADTRRAPTWCDIGAPAPTPAHPVGAARTLCAYVLRPPTQWVSGAPCAPVSYPVRQCPAVSHPGPPCAPVSYMVRMGRTLCGDVVPGRGSAMTHGVA